MIERIRRIVPGATFAPRLWAQQALFWGGAVAVALVAIFFAEVSAVGNVVFSALIKKSSLFAYIVTPAGFAFAVWLTRRFFVGAEGSGIPQTIAALEAPDIADRVSILSLRVALGKVLLTSIGLCAGASVGREGPTVQVGAAIMHKLGRLLRVPEARTRRALILAGGAAGIAAAFNTPLAGVLFAIEELSRSFEARTSGTALTAVIVAGIVSMALLGNYAYFGHTGIALALDQAWRPVLLCGICGGLAGGLFSRVLIFFSRGLPGACGVFMRNRPVAFAACCGFALAFLGQFCGHTVYGSGYEEAKGLVEGTRQLSFAFGPMKLLATIISYVSGLPGGLFAPSLAVGAGLGSDLAPFLPETPVAAVVILGMVGYFTGVVQVPITATIIVMEMTSDQSLTLPLMATAFLAQVCSRAVCPSPLYRTLAQSFLEQASRKVERSADIASAAPATPVDPRV